MEFLLNQISVLESRIKFCKCFRDDESKYQLSMLTKQLISLQNDVKQMEVSMSQSSSNNGSMFSNDLVVRKYQYQMYIMEHGTYTWDDVVEMDMRALRMAVDELLPIVITQVSTTISGGKSKRVTVVRAA
jgi:hypothetical protein